MLIFSLGKYFYWTLSTNTHVFSHYNANFYRILKISPTNFSTFTAAGSKNIR